MRISGIFAMSGDYGYDYGYESFFNGYTYGPYPRSPYYRSGYEGYSNRDPGRIYRSQPRGILGLTGNRY